MNLIAGVVRGLTDVSAESESVGDGMRTRDPVLSMPGVSLPELGGCHRLATSLTPRTLRFPKTRD